MKEPETTSVCQLKYSESVGFAVLFGIPIAIYMEMLRSAGTCACIQKKNNCLRRITECIGSWIMLFQVILSIILAAIAFVWVYSLDHKSFVNFYLDFLVSQLSAIIMDGLSQSIFFYYYWKRADNKYRYNKVEIAKRIAAVKKEQHQQKKKSPSNHVHINNHDSHIISTNIYPSASGSAAAPNTVYPLTTTTIQPMLMRPPVVETPDVDVRYSCGSCATHFIVSSSAKAARCPNCGHANALHA